MTVHGEQQRSGLAYYRSKLAAGVACPSPRRLDECLLRVGVVTMRSTEQNAVPWYLCTDSELREKIARLSEVERTGPKQLKGLTDRIDSYKAELERRQREATQRPQVNPSKAWLAQVGLIACCGP